MRGTSGGNHAVVIHFLINGRQSYLLASSLGLSINVIFVVVKIISPFRFVFARQCQEFMRRRRRKRRKRRKRISDTRRHIQEVEAEEVNWGVLASFFLQYSSLSFLFSNISFRRVFFSVFRFVNPAELSSSLCTTQRFSPPPIYFQHVLSISLSLFLPTHLKFLELHASPFYSGNIRCRFPWWAFPSWLNGEGPIKCASIESMAFDMRLVSHKTSWWKCCMMVCCSYFSKDRVRWTDDRL